MKSHSYQPKTVSATDSRTTISVLIADDHRLMREGLAKIIRSDVSMRVTGFGRDCQDTLSAAVQLHPDVLLLEHCIRGTMEIRLISQLRQQAPDVKILILTMCDEDENAEQAIRAGAMGFLTKKSTTATALLEAIRSVAAGRPRISPEAARSLAIGGDMRGGAVGSLDRLSGRERQVMELLVMGSTVTAIGQELGLSVKTVSTFKSRIKQKLSLAGLSNMVQFAVKYKLFPDSCSGQDWPPNLSERAGKYSHVASGPCNEQQEERRRCQLTESKVNVGLVLMNMLSREDAANYLALVRVPVEVAARVVGQPAKRRRLPPEQANGQVPQSYVFGAS